LITYAKRGIYVYATDLFACTSNRTQTKKREKQLEKNGNKIQARYYWNYVLKLEDTKNELKNNIKNKLLSGL